VLTLKSGSVFTVAGDANWLLRNGEDTDTYGHPVGGAAGGIPPQIVLKQGAFVWSDGYETNFYDPNGTVLISDTYRASAETTFNWDAALGDNGGWQEAYEDVSEGLYTLRATSVSPDSDESGLTISARTSVATGKVYIKLGGEIGAGHTLDSSGMEVTTKNFTNWDTNEWGNGPGGNCVPAAGKYKSVALNGLFPDQKSYVAIKNSNYAFHYYDYTGQAPYNFLTRNADDITGPKIRDDSSQPPDVYLPTDLDSVPFKWKLYGSPHFAEGESFAFLIWDQAPTKTVTLDITQYAGFDVSGTVTDIATVVIDYSAVTWAD
jgi:hypothetical protein